MVSIGGVGSLSLTLEVKLKMVEFAPLPCTPLLHRAAWPEQVDARCHSCYPENVSTRIFPSSRCMFGSRVLINSENRVDH